MEKTPIPPEIKNISMSNDFIFPKLKHDDTFEDIVCEILSREFQNPNIQRYGRKGQTQNGIDIVGIAGKDYTHDEVIGAQCKNHIIKVSDKDLKKEVEEELKKFEKNELPIDKFLFITSADNSPDVKNFVISLSKKRAKEGKCPVEIFFWDYITDKLITYKDILFKYFTYTLPTQKAEDISIPDLNMCSRQTLAISASQLTKDNEENLLKELVKVADQNLNGIRKSDSYNLYVGISTKKDVNFNKLVDLDINFSNLFSDEHELEKKFSETLNAIKSMVKIISSGEFSKKLVLYTDIEIGTAFLLGRIFRKHKFDVKIIFKNQIWTTSYENVPYVRSDILEDAPHITSNSNNDGVFIFNAVQRASAKDEITSYIESNLNSSRVTLTYQIATSQIESAAHALSTAENIAKKIHVLESWKIRKIHLFLLTPKPLAFLIGYLLNTLNSEIVLYFRNGSRTNYLVSGSIHNNTF